jgi:hypothetical protein
MREMCNSFRECVVNFLQIVCSIRNIVNHIAYIHYIENREDNMAS